MSKPMQRTPEQEFGARVHRTAVRQMQELLGTDAGKRAAQSITMAFVDSMRTAKKPDEWLNLSEGSIASCVATSASTELYPGGPNPTVYLVPQSGDLQWRITHRGLAVLASRAGFGLFPVPVSYEDDLEVAYGEVSRHSADPDAYPAGQDELRGVILVVRRLVDGVIITRAWVPQALIEQHRAISRMKNTGPWRDHYVAMAQKTAILWGAARGLIPVDSPELRAALAADRAGDNAIDIEEGAPLPARTSLGLAPVEDRPALTDQGADVPEWEEAAEELEQREPVEPQRTAPQLKHEPKRVARRGAPA